MFSGLWQFVRKMGAKALGKTPQETPPAEGFRIVNLTDQYLGKAFQIFGLPNRESSLEARIHQQESPVDLREPKSTPAVSTPAKKSRIINTTAQNEGKAYQKNKKR